MYEPFTVLLHLLYIAFFPLPLLKITYIEYFFQLWMFLTASNCGLRNAFIGMILYIKTSDFVYQNNYWCLIWNKDCSKMFIWHKDCSPDLEQRLFHNVNPTQVFFQCVHLAQWLFQNAILAQTLLQKWSFVTKIVLKYWFDTDIFPKCFSSFKIGFCSRSPPKP